MLNTGQAEHTAERVATSEGSSPDELVFVYADEDVPQEYSCLTPEPLPPFAFSLLLSRKPGSDSICFSMDEKEISPKDFLKGLLLK
jgi:hypothetical protein